MEVVAFSEELTTLDVNQSTPLDTFLTKANGLTFAGTDCAKPMVWALEKKKEFDVFVVYTDCETWYGEVS